MWRPNSTFVYSSSTRLVVTEEFWSSRRQNWKRFIFSSRECPNGKLFVTNKLREKELPVVWCCWRERCVTSSHHLSTICFHPLVLTWLLNETLPSWCGCWLWITCRLFFYCLTNCIYFLFRLSQLLASVFFFSFLVLAEKLWDFLLNGNPENILSTKRKLNR